MDAWTPSRCAPRSRSRSRWRWRVLRPFAAWLYPARLSRSRMRRSRSSARRRCASTGGRTHWKRTGVAGARAPAGRLRSALLAGAWPADRSLQSICTARDRTGAARQHPRHRATAWATDWRAGESGAEHFTVAILRTPRRSRLSLVAGLYVPATGRADPGADSRGNVVTPIVGRLAINGPPQRRAQARLAAAGPDRRDNSIRVKGGEVCLTWIARARWRPITRS